MNMNVDRLNCTTIAAANLNEEMNVDGCERGYTNKGKMSNVFFNTKGE